MPESRELLSWSDFGEGSRRLAQLVADTGYEPDIILAVARGGLLPAAAVAYALDVKNLFTMNIEFYTGDEERHDFPVMQPTLTDVIRLTVDSVLVPGDVADT